MGLLRRDLVTGAWKRPNVSDSRRNGGIDEVATAGVWEWQKSLLLASNWQKRSLRCVGVSVGIFGMYVWQDILYFTYARRNSNPRLHVSVLVCCGWQFAFLPLLA